MDVSVRLVDKVVSRNALMARINARLAATDADLSVRVTRGQARLAAFGRYCLRSRDGFEIVSPSVDLEKLGRALGVLREGEVLSA